MVWPGDRKVEELVTSVLSKDSRIDFSEIKVKVENGVVYLSGTVDSAAERRAAQEDLESAPPVETVVDQLTLRNFIERTDEELAESVRRALIRDITLDARQIKVEATGGVVTLSGRVESYAQKSAAENVALWTPGVVDVISHLEAGPLPGPPEEPD
ncbi:MAG: BON domain-containing protein [Armatimonadetes bacterium]|nr:BON domain-containing protein [Armatimonadota bacterium]